jgi:hypothetical protein
VPDSSDGRRAENEPERQGGGRPNGTPRAIALVAVAAAVIATAWIAKAAPSTIPPARGNARYLGGYPAIDYSQNVWATEKTTPLTVKGDSQLHPILQEPFFNSTRKKAGVLDFAEVQVRNVSKDASVVVTLRVMMGKELEPGSYAATIGPSETQAVFGLLKCDGMPPGRSSITLMASATGDVVLGTRADDGLRPIVIPPGSRGSGFLGAG